MNAMEKEEGDLMEEEWGDLMEVRKQDVMKTKIDERDERGNRWQKKRTM